MSLFAAASPRRKAAAGVVIILLAWGLTLGLSLAGLMTKYILTTLDHLYRTPLPPAKSQVVVVTVDQPDLDFFQKQGVSWPWPRQLYAPLIEFCQRGGARAVIFDVLYTEASVYGAEDDQRLAQAMEASGRVVLPFFLTREDKGADPQTEAVLSRAALPIEGTPPPGLTTYQGMTTPIPPLLKAATALGNVECHSDPDGIYRRLPLVSLYQGRFLPLLSFAALLPCSGPGKLAFRGRGPGPERPPGAPGPGGAAPPQVQRPEPQLQAPWRGQRHPVGRAPQTRSGSLL